MIPGPNPLVVPGSMTDGDPEHDALWDDGEIENCGGVFPADLGGGGGGSTPTDIEDGSKGGGKFRWIYHGLPASDGQTYQIGLLDGSEFLGPWTKLDKV